MLLLRTPGLRLEIGRLDDCLQRFVCEILDAAWVPFQILEFDLMSAVRVDVGVLAHFMPIVQVQEHPVVRVRFGGADGKLFLPELQ
jgi:hypothetical protein